MAEKQNTPQQPQQTSSIDTDLFVKGMTTDPNATLVGKDQWTHARNAINNSKDGDVGTLGNEPANKQCSSAPFTIIGNIHLYGDKWVLFSTNNEQSEIGTWDDSECKYETLVNDYSCYMCEDQFTITANGSDPTPGIAPFGPCLNFSTQYLITGASKENFDCSWQVYWDDGLNPSRTLNLDNIPWHKKKISDEGDACVIYENMEPLCLDCEQIRLAPLVDIPCIKLSKSADGGQLRNGSYQAFIAYTINDQIVGDYYGMSNIQPLFNHEDLLSGLELTISNLDKDFEYYQLVICSFNQGEQQAKAIGIYSTEQTNISIDYINQKLQSIPIDVLPLSTPSYEKSDKTYVVNDYLVRSGPTEQFDFNYQPLANNIHVHYTVTQFPSDYYVKGGNKTTFMRDEVYSFFIRFIYNTGEKSSSYHIPGRAPYTWAGINDAAGANPNVLDPWPGNNDLGTASWVANGSVGTATADRLFEVHNTADDGWWYNSSSNHPDQFTEDGGTVIREGHMGYWESTERYPQDPIRYGTLCGQPIRHHKMPDESTSYTEMIADPAAPPVTPNNYLDRSSGDANGNPNQFINILGAKFYNIAWPRYNGSTDEDCGPDDGRPAGDLIPNIVGYEILVGSREGNKSILAKGIARNMRQYNIPPDAQGHETTGTTGFIPNFPFNDCMGDPYLQGGNSWTYNSGSGNVQNQQGYGGGPIGTGNGMTATNLYTFHSPETSFNKPFLSPYELKSYGMTTGTSMGRFKVSETHPQHKLLRNLSMWIAIIVGVGYAIQEMRGRRKMKVVPPKSLELGLSGSGDAHTGGGDYTETVNGGAANVMGTGGWVISGNAWGNWNRAGGAWREAAPSSNNDGGLMTNQNMTMMNAYSNYNTAETLLTTGTVIGAPKLTMNAPIVLGYQNTVRGQMGTMGDGRGRIGAGQEIEFQGSRFESAPSITQLLFGVYNFMAFTATGGQEIIDLIYNLVSYQDYAWKYSGHGLYWSTQMRPTGSVFRQIIDKGRYIGSSMQNLTANIKINNLQRPSTVAISTVTNGADFAIPTAAQDNSKFIIGNNPSIGGSNAPCNHFNPSASVVSNIGAHYCALKVAFRNQYGQLDQIKQVPTGCIRYFEDQRTYDQQGEVVPWTYQILLDANGEEINNTTRFNTHVIYGGDCYLNRYSEKVIMPFFWDFLAGQPDGFPYDYKLRANVPRPIYWMDTKKFELSQLVRSIVSFNFIAGLGASGQNISNAMPSGLYYLDRPGTDRQDDDMQGANQGNSNTSAGGPATNPTAGTGAPDSDQGGRSIFHIKNGYMYTHCNGINEFFVESTINTALRDWEDVDEKRHYDWLEYTDVEALFNAEIIREDNFYKYDSSLSRGRFFTQLISFGFLQARDYDPLVAEKCYSHYPKRLIYSLQAQKEAKKDFWRVFLPLNYQDFKNRVNVIKPVSKSGAMVLFPNLAPKMWQGVDQLETELGTKLTIGDGGLFSQPMQNIVNTDVAYEYGSCESARSVVNTPSGLFYISQAQGKIFHYTGKGLVNIADKGMKQWFNKYLPSFLLAQYPEMEKCTNWTDNPVAGIGCQSVYDPNYDLIYFCKKDYEPLVPECVDYIPCEGFVYNNTTCNNIPATPCCPDGYNYVPPGTSCPAGYQAISCLNGDPCCTDNAGTIIPATITEAGCEKITYFPAIEDQQGGQVDIVFAIDSSNSVQSNQNVGNMQKFIRTMTDQLSTQLGSGDVRMGLVHFGGGRCTANPLFAGQICDCTGCTNPDEMFETNNQVPLTSSATTINNWIGSPGSPYTAGSGWPADCSSVYGVSTCAGGQDRPWGTDLLAGFWTGLNLLYGQASRQVPKVLITLFDGPQYTVDSNPIDPIFYTSSSYTGTNGVTGTDIYLNMTVNPPTADISYTKQPNDWTLNHPEAKWFQDNVINNPAYNASPYVQKSYSVVVEQSTHLDYAQQFSSSSGGYDNGNAYAGMFDNIAQMEAIANEIITDVTPPATYSCADPTCDLVTNAAGQYMCECREWVPVEMIDNTTPISIDDPIYFKDTSWTISYDPKYESWMSFHDWHPQLTIPSLNHFFTTNNYEDLESEPNCPPGFTWNPSTQTCCQVFQGEYLADITVEEVPVDFYVERLDCKLDIVIAIDRSGSTDTFLHHFRSFVDDFVAVFKPDMDNGDVQIGLSDWHGCDSYRNRTPDMSGNLGNGITMSNYTVSTDWGTDHIGTDTDGTAFYEAFDKAQTQLSQVQASTLGDRTDQQAYKRICIIMADGGNNCSTVQSSQYYQALQGAMPSAFPQTDLGIGYANAAETAGLTTIASESWGLYCHPTGTAPATQFNAVTANNTAYQNLNLTPNTVTAFATTLASSLCTLPPVCTCPEGFERIASNLDGTAPPHVVLAPGVDCETPNHNGVCRKMECECSESDLPFVGIPVTQTGFCPTDIMNGIALYYNEDTGVGNSLWTGYTSNPLTCHYDYECCVEGTTTRGGIWKHNDRCDLYVNYYGDDYPWEVEWVESIGQTVNTIRSIEYQLESYRYKGNLADGCGDRFHDLDWNFDDAIIHNTEQVSGLLSFNLDPKNNAPLITTFPQITGADIQILYSKVEQKYRFNQFWDITRDRGEFDINENASIFITQLNGYIRDLNVANLDYFKPAFQRKKFRHYWNKVVLRKNISGDRKMIFKLANTKINASFR